MGKAEKLKEQRKIERIRKQLNKEKRLRVVGMALAGVVLFSVVGGGVFFGVSKWKASTNSTGGDGVTTHKIGERQYSQAPDMQIDTSKTYIAKFESSEGNFEVTLDAKSAPKTSNNFVVLAKDGFYNGLTFHRIVSGFMIQGGDPEGSGAGGPGYTIPAEIGLKHTKGAIATARTSDEVNPERESSGSQFFIDLEDQPSLDEGGYTVFGYVSSGMEVVEKIGLTEVVDNGQGENSKPVKDVLINKITIEVK